MNFDVACVVGFVLCGILFILEVIRLGIIIFGDKEDEEEGGAK